MTEQRTVRMEDGFIEKKKKHKKPFKGNFELKTVSNYPKFEYQFVSDDVRGMITKNGLRWSFKVSIDIWKRNSLNSEIRYQSWWIDIDRCVASLLFNAVHDHIILRVGIFGNNCTVKNEFRNKPIPNSPMKSSDTQSNVDINFTQLL